METFINTQPVTYPDAVPAWIAGIKSKIQRRILSRLTEDTSGVDRYIEVVELDGYPGVILACGFYQADINQALTRAGLYMGAGVGIAKHTVVPLDAHVLRNYEKLVAGHNLPGAVVREFARTATLGENEASFFDALLGWPRVRARGDRFYLIGLAVQNTKSWRNVISHEICHARYYLEDAYRSAVERFWADDLKDRELVIQTLAAAYNAADEDLIRDEFQAYLLQDEAADDRLSALVPRYRPVLLERLRASGVTLT